MPCAWDRGRQPSFPVSAGRAGRSGGRCGWCREIEEFRPVRGTFVVIVEGRPQSPPSLDRELIGRPFGIVDDEVVARLAETRTNRRRRPHVPGFEQQRDSGEGIARAAPSPPSIVSRHSRGRSISVVNRSGPTAISLAGLVRSSVSLKTDSPGSISAAPRFR